LLNFIKNIIIKYFINKNVKVLIVELISDFLELIGFLEAMVSARISDAGL